MGCCLSTEIGYLVLRKSIPGALLTDVDFDAFFLFCKAEVHTISNNIHLSPSQLFYVVISGEVLATLTVGGKHHVAAIYYPGEMIHLFNSGESIQSDGSIISEGVKLTFSFRSTSGKVAKVIGADRNGMEEFLKRRTHLTRLKDLLDLNLNIFLEGTYGTYMQSLTKSQVRQGTLSSPIITQSTLLFFFPSSWSFWALCSRSAW